MRYEQSGIRPALSFKLFDKRAEMKIFFYLCFFLFTACSTYLGYELKPGDSLAKVQQKLGQPAMRWQNENGSEKLAFPRGPMGYQTYMVVMGADGKLKHIDNVMNEQNHARIKPGMTQNEVLKILGPSYPHWTVYFERRDELVWEWRYCDTWSEAARFNVLFDQRLGTVRSTLSLTEAQRGLCGNMRCRC